jgi:zinc transport system substrate-binding protein
MHLPGKPLCGAIGLVLWALSALPAAAAATRMFVSIPPQKYFVERIGGPFVDVSVLVPAAADPHTYEPKPKQMVGLSQSAVYFALGVEFEKVWLNKIARTNPGLKIVHTDAGIEKIMLDGHDHAHKDPHPAQRKGHRHGGTPDPHIWLSPPLVKRQAERILAALGEVDPANQSRYQERCRVFLTELDALDEALKALFAGRKGEPFLVLHPSWGYFAQAYGLKQVAIEIEGKDPKPAQIQRLIRYAREQGIKVVFVQPQFSAKSAAMVAREIGGGVVTADPLAEDWAENLHEVARKFRAVMK